MVDNWCTKLWNALENEHDEKSSSLTYEILRDVAPCYFFRRSCLRQFQERRKDLWLEHVDTFAKLKTNYYQVTEPTSETKTKQPLIPDPQHPLMGSARIDFVAGHLDILDRKFGVLLQVQALIAVTAGVLVNAFKDSLLPLLYGVGPWAILVALTFWLLALFLMFARICWLAKDRKRAVLTIVILLAVAIAAAIALFLTDFHPHVDWLSIAGAGLVTFLITVWIVTTFLCLRGAGRARWGEMNAVSNRAEAIEQEEAQVEALVQSVVSRSAKYRAAVLLMFVGLTGLIVAGGLLVLLGSSALAPSCDTTG